MLHGPVDRLDLGRQRDAALRAVRNDLRDQQPGVEREPGDADTVRRVRGYLPCDERAVPVGVMLPGAADERDPGCHASDELGWEKSIPESITATLTGASLGRSDQWSQA